MSFLDSMLGFELFNAKDMWKKVKKNPEQLLLGGADPLGAKIAGGITGKKYEPLVDQMGGAYGGHTLSAFGNNEGGVYGRAKAAGIDTGPGSKAQDAAHVIAAFYALGGGQGLGGGASGGGGQGLGVFSNGGQAGMTGVGGGNAGALAQSGAISNGAGTASIPGLGNLQQLQKMMPQAQGMPPQQQPMPQQFAPTNQDIMQGVDKMRTPPPSMGEKVMAGLGRARDSLTPIDPNVAAQMNPEYIKQLRNNAMLKMGLGMMAASDQGGRFGESVLAGLGGAQHDFGRNIEQSYTTGVKQREEKRLLDRQGILDKRYEDETGYRRGRDTVEDTRYGEEREDTKAYRERQLALEAERNRIAAREAENKGGPKLVDIDRLSNQFQKQAQKVQESGTFAEQIIMLSANPNIATDPSAQTALVFAFGKMLDPDSVVREAEYKILEQSRGLQEQLQAIMPRLQEGARLTPGQIQRMRQVAAQFAGKNRERLEALQSIYNEKAVGRGMDPFQVTGSSTRKPTDPYEIDFSKFNTGGGGLGRPRSADGMQLVDESVVTVDY